MFIVENSEENLKYAENMLASIQAEVISQQALLRGEQKNIMQKKDRLESEKSVKMGSITNESLEIYSNLRKSKRGIAVARVDEKTCLACGSILTPAEWQAARSPHQIVFCSSCGRILYAG
ncbi:MAG: C4-type zinc ribbon domain-containing protein, partial [Anaerolineaceae bacterium]|nr:C4-type zinc ribbon domain-containing protein [Anaerolineaceae bacterium]